jgi:asparagine synthetase B (glutamine-hydrolysing)
MSDEMTIRGVVNITPRLLAMLDEVARARGVDPGQALADGIGLLKVAEDAKAAGKRLVIRGEGGEEMEIKGL